MGCHAADGRALGGGASLAVALHPPAGEADLPLVALPAPRSAAGEDSGDQRGARAGGAAITPRHAGSRSQAIGRELPCHPNDAACAGLGFVLATSGEEAVNLAALRAMP